jgi:hypothetical protein
MNPQDLDNLNLLFNTALLAALPYSEHEQTRRRALALEARLKKLHEMEQAMPASPS